MARYERPRNHRIVLTFFGFFIFRSSRTEVRLRIQARPIVPGKTSTFSALFTKYTGFITVSIRLITIQASAPARTKSHSFFFIIPPHHIYQKYAQIITPLSIAALFIDFPRCAPRKKRRLQAAFSVLIHYFLRPKRPLFFLGSSLTRGPRRPFTSIT